MTFSNRRKTSLFSVVRQSNSRRRSPQENRQDLQQLLALILITAGLVLGGGGTTNPHTEVLLEGLVALLMLGWSLLPGTASRPGRGLLIAVTALVVAIPLAQLIPLPPAWWHALPGRETEIAALSLIGRKDAWMPWSVAPPQTLAVALALVPPLAAMWFVAALDERGRTATLRAVVALGFLSVVLGALQVAAPPGRAPTFYDYYHQGFVIGFQANKNAEVDVLLIALLGAAALYAPYLARKPRAVAAEAVSPAMIAFASVVLVLLAGAVLTGSRGGILMLPAACLGAFAIAFSRSARSRTTLTAIAAGALSLGAAAVPALRDNAMVARVMARFTGERDFRFELWTDTLYAVHQTWPFGSGMGTFVQVMTPAERLEVLDETVPMRAHNDFLELLLESGICGPIVVGLLGVVLAVMAIKAWKSGNVPRQNILFAVATFLVIAVHSLVDYPMRSMSLAILVGVGAGLLVPFAPGRPEFAANVPGTV